jgi:hypothetical protein
MITPIKLLTMKRAKKEWSLERIHNVTGAIFYLSPGEVNWIPEADHIKYGTRYGHWGWSDVEELLEHYSRQAPDFTYKIVLWLSVKKDRPPKGHGG